MCKWKCVGLLVVILAVSAATASADSMEFGVESRANGVDWNTAYSLVNNEVKMMVGQDSVDFNGTGGVYGKTSMQLRFDVSALAGLYSSIDSATITLGQLQQRAGSGSGTLSAYLVSSTNAGWTSNGTWGTIDGTNAWAGGSTGCTTAGTDYIGSALGSVAFDSTNPVGTPYYLTMTGDAAKQAVASWASNGTNAGFVLFSDWLTGAVDSRCILNKYPTLTVNYTAVPEPSVVALIATGIFGLLAYAWRNRK